MHIRFLPTASVLLWFCAIGIGIGAIDDPVTSMFVILAILLAGATIVTGICAFHTESVMTRRVIWAALDSPPGGRVVTFPRAVRSDSGLDRR